MQEDQRRILTTTLELIQPFSWMSILWQVGLFTLVGGVVFWIGFSGFDPIAMSTLFVFAILYTFAKVFLTRKRLQKVLQGRLEYLNKKHPSMTLFVPILEKIGRRFYLRPAALFFDGKTKLEAFRQSFSMVTPSESITCEYGPHFQIEHTEEQASTISYVGRFMEKDYRFHTTNDPVIVSSILQDFSNKKGQ